MFDLSSGAAMNAETTMLNHTDIHMFHAEAAEAVTAPSCRKPADDRWSLGYLRPLAGRRAG
jgi:hypothetical protein